MVKTISVLIPTLGRQKELIDTVQALLKQTRLPDEIVIVDQNGGRFPDLDRFFAGIPTVRHIKVPEPGVSINYNRALQVANGDVVLYLDDDVIPDPDLIAAHLKNYQNAQDRARSLGGVAGRVEEPNQKQKPETIREIGVYHPWSGRLTTNFNAIGRTEVQFAQGANMSFLRKALLSVGGFDEGFEGNGYFFETDGALRLKRAGYRMVFDPQAKLFHLMAPSGGARVKSKATHTFYFVRNGIRLVRRHSPAWVLLYFYLKMALYGAAKAVYNRDAIVFLRTLRALTDGIVQSMKVKSYFMSSCDLGDKKCQN